jgi:hypothetical protein
MRTGPALEDRQTGVRLATAVAMLIAAGVLVVVTAESTSAIASHDRHMYGSNQTTLAEEERSRGQCCVDANHCC